MPDTTTFSAGLPVEIGRIDCELKKLWKEGEGAVTRASLMNLAIYCEGVEAMAKNTALISDIMRDHACRAILIATEPGAPQNKVQAWISAHCHVSRAGAKQVCCEQITFLLEGDSRRLIPNIVFSHLDSDLPLYFWRQGEFSAPVDEQLWTWVDRLIFDSQPWSRPGEQFALLRNSLAETKPRLLLCDLNWTRLLNWRQAVAEFCDTPENLAHLNQIESAVISHAPGHRSTALLFIGWLSAQLGWRPGRPEKDGFTFVQQNTNSVLRFEIREEGTHAIGKLRLSGGSAGFQIAYESGSAFLHEEIYLPDGHAHRHLLLPGKEDVLDLFNEELMRGGNHQVYLRALAAAEPLF